MSSIYISIIIIVHNLNLYIIQIILKAYLHAVCKSAVRSRDTMSLAWAFFSCLEGVGLVVSLSVVVDVESAALVLFLPRRCLTLLSAIVGYRLIQGVLYIRQRV